MQKSKLIIPKKKFKIAGAESKIYTINDGLYKEFKTIVSQEVRKRKKERLLYLEQFDNLKQYYPQIKYFVELIKNKYIKGYVMSDENSETLTRLTNIHISTEKKLEILNEIREILALFRSIGLYYYDIHLDNVRLRPDGHPIFLDIDSILFEDEKKPDFDIYGLNNYISHGGKLDEHFQRIKFNILAQDMLFDRKELERDSVAHEMFKDSLYDFPEDGYFAHEYLTEHVRLVK